MKNIENTSRGNSMDNNDTNRELKVKLLFVLRFVLFFYN